MASLYIHVAWRVDRAEHFRNVDVDRAMNSVAVLRSKPAHESELNGEAAPIRRVLLGLLSHHRITATVAGGHRTISHDDLPMQGYSEMFEDINGSLRFSRIWKHVSRTKTAVQPKVCRH
jgi:hypothetical protein